MFPSITSSRARATVIGALVVVAAAAYWAWPTGVRSKAEIGATASADAPRAVAHNQASVDLSDSQLASVKVAPVEDLEFPVEKQAVGSIDFDEDMETQVFAPYQGKIIALFAAVGDDVKKGQTLFTLDSPDLLQAESTLIAAAGVLELTTRNLARLREL